MFCYLLSDTFYGLSRDIHFTYRWKEFVYKLGITCYDTPCIYKFQIRLFVSALFKHTPLEYKSAPNLILLHCSTRKRAKIHYKFNLRTVSMIATFRLTHTYMRFQLNLNDKSGWTNLSIHLQNPLSRVCIFPENKEK